MKPHEGRKRRWGDRYDGFKVRNLDPMGLVIPYIMPQKVDSWVLFEARIEISKTEEFIKKMRKEDIPSLTLYHVIFAALVRAMVDVPEMNRFVKNCKIYSGNHIKGAMVVMKGMKRATDGYIYTIGFKSLKKYISNPELLMEKPEKITFDIIDKIKQ